MNTYQIPEQPDITVVWDALGQEWKYEQQSQIGGWVWENSTTRDVLDWDELLSIFGPVTDYPPEPDWLDAPAVYARCGYCSHEDYGLQITLHGPVLNRQKWECAECQTATDWSNLRDVTPLYPKGQEA